MNWLSEHGPPVVWVGASPDTPLELWVELMIHANRGVDQEYGLVVPLVRAER